MSKKNTRIGRNSSMLQFPPFAQGPSDITTSDTTLQLVGQLVSEPSLHAKDATALQQVPQVPHPFRFTAKPDVTVASHQNQPTPASASRNRRTDSRRGVKAKTSGSPASPDVSEKRLREQKSEREYFLRKQGAYNELYDAYSSLPEGYRRGLDERIGSQEVKKTQNLAQADVLRRTALALKDLKCFVSAPEAGAVSDEVRLRQQEGHMETDEQDNLDIMMRVTDPVPPFPGPSETSVYLPGGYNQATSRWEDDPIDDDSDITPSDFDVFK